jgi:AAA domain
MSTEAIIIVQKGQNKMDTETLILAHLTCNDAFLCQVIDYIEPAMFEDKVHGHLFDCMKTYHADYGKMPTKEAMEIALGEINIKKMNDDQHEQGLHLLRSLHPDNNTVLQYLMDKSESWAKGRKQYDALLGSFEITKGAKTGLASDLMKEAEGFSFKPKSLDDHFMKFGARTKKRNPIISGIMSPQDVTFFVGQPGSYKSFIAFLMAYRTATGTDFESHACQQGAVVIFVGEGDEGIEDRVLALEAQYGFRWEDIPCEVISLSDRNNDCPNYDADSKDKNKDRALWVKAHVEAVQLKYDMKVNHIIFDTFRTAVNNIDENAAKHVTPAMMHFKAIARDNDAAVSVFHHTNRELKDFSGSGSFKSDCDNLYFILANDDMTAILSRDDGRGKQKDFAMLDDIAFKMVVHVTGEYENGETVTSLAATINDGTDKEPVKEKGEDIVLTWVKEHCNNVFNEEPLLKSVLLKRFMERRKITGSESTLLKRFREDHFLPLIAKGKIAFTPTTYIGAPREDGIISLPLIEVAPQAIAAE